MYANASVVFRADADIFKSAHLALKYVNVSEYSRKAYLVLVVKIASRAEFQNKNAKPVLSILECIGNIKGTVTVRTLAVSDKSAVEPDVSTAINTFKMKLVSLA